MLDSRRKLDPAPIARSPVSRGACSTLPSDDDAPLQQNIRPFYFDDRRLFGVYYAATTRHAGLPVLVCPPIGHEHVRSYNAIRKLCERLSRNGFPVLKFDYHGLGDSAGDGLEAHVGKWRDDIRAAASELGRRSGQTEITLVGLRLGVPMAAGIRLEGITLRNLVLWDPVVDGNVYLSQLRELHRLCLIDTRRFHKKQPERINDTELLGFRFPPRMQHSITGLRLLNRPYPYDNCFLVTSSQQPEYESLEHTLDRNTKGRFTHALVTEPVGWDDHGRIEAMLIANRAVSAISEKITNGFV